MRHDPAVAQCLNNPVEVLPAIKIESRVFGCVVGPILGVDFEWPEIVGPGFSRAPTRVVGIRIEDQLVETVGGQRVEK